MGMYASAILAFGIVVTEDDIWHFTETTLPEEQRDNFCFEEFMDDEFSHLEVHSCGANTYETYLIGPKEYSFTVYWDSWEELNTSKIRTPRVDELSELDVFHYEFGLPKDRYAAWHLGAYYG